MIKRSEIKIIWNDFNIFNARNFIISSNAINLYPNRKINSVYFDNIQKQMYFDSVEGIIPRKKIRIRYYGTDSEELIRNKFFEIKYTYDDYREKETKEIVNEVINIYKDPYYGECSKNMFSKGRFGEFFLLCTKD